MGSPLHKVILASQSSPHAIPRCGSEGEHSAMEHRKQREFEMPSASVALHPFTSINSSSSSGKRSDSGVPVWYPSGGSVRRIHQVVDERIFPTPCGAIYVTYQLPGSLWYRKSPYLHTVQETLSDLQLSNKGIEIEQKKKDRDTGRPLQYQFRSFMTSKNKVLL
jgi:hypothetical protein